MALVNSAILTCVAVFVAVSSRRSREELDAVTRRLEKLETALSEQRDRVATTEVPRPSPPLPASRSPEEEVRTLLPLLKEEVKKYGEAMTDDARHRTEQQNVDRIMAYLEKELSLTLDQATNVREAYNEYYRSRERDIKARLEPTEEIKRMRTTSTELYQSLKGLLLPDQYSRFAELCGWTEK
jgi:hypothetical protein